MATRQSQFTLQNAAPLVEIARNSRPTFAQTFSADQLFLTVVTLQHLPCLYLSKLNGLISPSRSSVFRPLTYLTTLRPTPPKPKSDQSPPLRNSVRRQQYLSDLHHLPTLSYRKQRCFHFPSRLQKGVNSRLPSQATTSSHFIRSAP